VSLVQRSDSRKAKPLQGNLTKAERWE